MKFAIIGSGAVGGYFGARLHEAGHTVYFLARGSHLEAIRKNGLQIKSVAGDYKALNVESHETVQTIPSVDVVLVAVKAWQVSEIAPKLKSLAKGSTYFVPLQNGVEAHGILEEVLGKERVLGGLCGLISFIEKPGVIQHAGAEPYVTIGEYHGQSSSRTKALQEAFSPCIGAKANISDDIEKSVWEKFLLISAFSGVGAVTRVPIGIIRSIPETRKLLDDALKEVMQVANARGVNLDQISLKKTWDFFDNLPPQGTASMQRDIMDGKPSELESQTGTIVRYGKESNVPTPINTFIYNSLLPVEKIARREKNLSN